MRRTNPEQTIVLDTKWKIVDDLIPGDEDLKQMYVYNLFWNCKHSVLLYPSAEKNSNYGDYVDYRNKEEHDTKCSMLTVNVLDESCQLDKNFGTTVLEEVLQVKASE